MYLTQQMLSDRFNYHEGKLFYKIKCGKSTPGIEAGCVGLRYFMIGINKKVYRRHQIVFIMHHGYLPKVVDHIDGNSFNDNIENLRDVSQKINCLNRKIDKRNKSGYRGVSIRSDKNKPFMASINNSNGKRINLGVFETAKEASIAFETAAKLFHNGGYSDRAITDITEKVQNK